MKESKERKIAQYLFGIYCAALIIQNTLAMKSIDVLGFTVTTGVLVSPLLFIAQDVSSEVFGYKQTKHMIMLSFAMNFIAVALYQFAIALPSSAVWFNQVAFSSILGTTVRISLASFLAYVLGSLANSKIMVQMKEQHPDSLFVRAITSTVVGQLLDNAIFSFVAFAFVMPISNIFTMIIGATLFETVYEVVLYPVTKFAIKKVRQNAV